MKYRPRPQSAKYRDADCPPEVLAIYDNRGQSFDQYTVIYRTMIADANGDNWLSLRGMSEAPSHPQGFGIMAEYRAHEIVAFRDRSRRFACRWSTLPEAVKDCVRRDCLPET